MGAQTEKLGTDPVMPLLLRLALPSMAGLIIGKYVADLGLAAMNAAMPISMVIFAVSILIGRGSAVLYSIELGRKNYTEAQKLFGMSMLIL